MFCKNLDSAIALGLIQLSHTDKKENQIFLLCKEIQSGAVAKSYMRKGEEMQKYFPIYVEAVSHATAPF
jgi:hypothetical protein